MRAAIRYLLLLCLLFVGLVPSMLLAQGDEPIELEEVSKREVLYFPPGLTMPEEVREHLPEWVKLNPDGTIAEKIVLPKGYKIPKTIHLPERIVKVPEAQEDGTIVWQEYKAPAVTINTADTLRRTPSVRP